MAASNRGIPALPSTLIRPQAPPEPNEPAAEVETQGQPDPDTRGRGGEPKSPRARSRKSASAEKPEPTTKRGLYLTDSVWERLQLESIRRRKSVSAIAGAILERNLPRLSIHNDNGG